MLTCITRLFPTGATQSSRHHFNRHNWRTKLCKYIPMLFFFKITVKKKWKFYLLVISVQSKWKRSILHSKLCLFPFHFTQMPSGKTWIHRLSSSPAMGSLALEGNQSRRKKTLNSTILYSVKKLSMSRLDKTQCVSFSQFIKTLG